MAKRPRSESAEDVNLDQRLRPVKVQRVKARPDEVPLDDDNLMDNWLISSNKLREQRYGDSAGRASWAARRALDPQEQCKVPGRWRYDLQRKERIWVKHQRQTRWNFIARTGDLTLDGGLDARFPINDGDQEISFKYREYWIGTNKRTFLDSVYGYGSPAPLFMKSETNTDNSTFAFIDEPDTIPEETIWRIFRCLVSELVPEVCRTPAAYSPAADSNKDQKWPGAPAYIIDGPNTIWQVGKCMLHILTRGRFWDEDNNVLNPIDNGVKFGVYKKTVLQQKYSKNLMKYVLGCLHWEEPHRMKRSELLDHFEDVFAVYNGTFVQEIIDSDDDLAYEGINPLIPRGLTRAEGRVYEKLLRIVEDRFQKGMKDHETQYTPRVFTITDLAKDYDDLMAMMVLKELHRLGAVVIEGFVANLEPPEQRARFGRGALDTLGLQDIPCGVGTIGDKRRRVVHYEHEFGNTEGWMVQEDRELPPGLVLPDGQDLLARTFEKAIKHHHKLTLLTISSLMDAAQFVETPYHRDLCKKGLSNVVLQGGYRVINGILTADPSAANNGFDMDSAHVFHKFMQDNNIPSTAWTKVAAQQVSIYNELFKFLDKTKHPLGHYLREVQLRQDISFYDRACSNNPYAPHMTQEWFVLNKSTWFLAGHECDEPYPLGEKMVPYFTKVVAYDALAAIGAAGKDVLDAFQVIKPHTTRPDSEDPLHHLVGVPGIRASEGQPALPEEHNFDADSLGLLVTALMKGSILATPEQFWEKKKSPYYYIKGDMPANE
jgi:hypothetical protein